MVFGGAFFGLIISFLVALVKYRVLNADKKRREGDESGYEDDVSSGWLNLKFKYWENSLFAVFKWITVGLINYFTNNKHFWMSVQEQTQQLNADNKAAAAEAPAEKRSFENDDGIIRVSAKEKNKGRQIGYALNRLKADHPVTLQACGSAINSAIFMSSAIRTKLGDVHQVVSLTEKKDDRDDKKGREIMGIQIVLSTKEFDVDNVGYMKAELKGFWAWNRKKLAKKPE